jgi:sporulation protein YlmC with PRC-barrel domain
MKTVIYSLTGLFAISLFIVGSSFADEMMTSGAVTGRQWMAPCSDSFKVSDVIGLDLEDTRKDRIGTITDVSIDPSTGRIDSFLINDIAGAGGAVVAVPLRDISMWGATTFVYSPSEHMFRFHSSTDGLGVGESPYVAYNLDRLPHMEEGYYESGKFAAAHPTVCINRHYGLQPYWEEE